MHFGPWQIFYLIPQLYFVLESNFRWACCDVISLGLYNQLLQQMRSDIALLTLEDGASPIQNPSTAAEDARLASLISLDGILKQIKVLTFLKTSFLIYLIIELVGAKTSNIIKIYLPGYNEAILC